MTEALFPHQGYLIILLYWSLELGSVEIVIGKSLRFLNICFPFLNIHLTIFNRLPKLASPLSSML